MGVQTPPLKPGILSSELWYSVLVSAFGMLVTTGKITPDQADALVRGVVTVVGGLTTVIPVLVYLYQRYVLKKTQIQQSVVNPTVVQAVPNGGAVGQYIPQPIP